MGGEAPACPEVTTPDPHLNVRIPPLPPPVNAGAPRAPSGDQEQQQAAEGAGGDGGQAGDASVGVSLGAQAALKPAGGGQAAGGWGTSNIGRPSNLAGGAGHANAGLFAAAGAAPAGVRWWWREP